MVSRPCSSSVNLLTDTLARRRLIDGLERLLYAVTDTLAVIGGGGSSRPVWHLGFWKVLHIRREIYINSSSTRCSRPASLAVGDISCRVHFGQDIHQRQRVLLPHLSTASLAVGISAPLIQGCIHASRTTENVCILQYRLADPTYV
jgi:hypothetical protein